jgi:hypothetical protein
VQFSIWTYLPNAALVARPLLAAALLLLALSPLVRRPVSDPREQAALAATLLIGAQLLIGYWFYSYLTWCYPLLVIAVIRARPDQETAVAEAAVAEAAVAEAAVAEAAVAEAAENASVPDLAKTAVA